MAAGSIETASQGYVIALLLFSNPMLAETYDHRAPLPTGCIPTPTIDQLDASIRSMRIAR